VRTLALVVAAVLSVGACAAGDPPRWRVVDGELRAPDGRTAILRGANLSGKHKWSPYFDFHRREDFVRLRAEWGLNTIRLLTVWAAVEPAEGQLDAAYLDALAERVAWAEEAGLSVVVDMHQDLYGEGFAGGDGAPRWTCDDALYAAYVPRTPWFFGYFDENMTACIDRFWESPRLRARFVAAWRAVAVRLASSPAVVGFDAMNEPHFGTYSIYDFEADRLQPLYEELTRAVREVAPGWVAFLEPGASRNAGIPTGLKPFGVRDVVYAPHLYDNGAEGGGGFDEARRAAYLEHARALGDEARALGAALWIGEYGGVAAAAGIGPYMDAAYAATGELGAGSSYWEYGKNGGYGMLDENGAEKPALMAVLVRPAPVRVAGRAVRWAWDDGARRLTLRYRPDRAATLPTEIALPPRLFPNGAAVGCGGCAVELGDGVARLVSAPPGSGDGEVTVTVEPSP